MGVQAGYVAHSSGATLRCLYLMSCHQYLLRTLENGTQYIFQNFIVPHSASMPRYPTHCPESVFDSCVCHFTHSLSIHASVSPCRTSQKKGSGVTQRQPMCLLQLYPMLPLQNSCPPKTAPLQTATEPPIVKPRFT